MKQKIEALEQLARDTVGDGKSPNLFFVSIEGVIITVTRSFNVAYAEWKDLPRNSSALSCCVINQDNKS